MPKQAKRYILFVALRGLAVFLQLLWFRNLTSKRELLSISELCKNHNVHNVSFMCAEGLVCPCTLSFSNYFDKCPSQTQACQCSLQNKEIRDSLQLLYVPVYYVIHPETLQNAVSNCEEFLSLSPLMCSGWRHFCLQCWMLCWLSCRDSLYTIKHYTTSLYICVLIHMLKCCFFCLISVSNVFSPLSDGAIHFYICFNTHQLQQTQTFGPSKILLLYRSL